MGKRAVSLIGTSCNGLRALAIGALALLCSNVAQASPITSGDIVVLRVGDGTTTPNGSASAVTLDEYSVSYSGAAPTALTFVQSIAMPSTTAASGNRAINQGGTAAAEGGLALSGDSQYLTLVGYNAVLGSAASGGSANRVIGRITVSSGAVDTTTSLTDAAGSSNAWRGAYTTNGTDIWAAGSTGARYTTFGSTTSTSLGATANNSRRVLIYKGQLYQTEAATSRSGVETVGTGAPTTTGQTISLLPGFSTVSGTYSDYDFFFADDTTIYAADDTSTVKGLQKWKFDGTNWNKLFSHPIALQGGAGIKSLSGMVDASGNVTMFASTTGTGANFLMGLSDTLSNTSSAAVTENTLADVTVPAGFNATGTAWNFRGVAIVPEPGSLSLLAAAGVMALSRRRRLR